MSINGWLLRKACRNGELAEVRSLLQDEGIKNHINDACARGHTPLHRAASRGNLEVANVLLDAGAQVDTSCRFGYTPLHEAACRGHAELTRLLLSRGANPNVSAYSKSGATARNGWTPLFVAARHGHASVVKELLEFGADIDRCDDGWTCVHSAASGGFDAVISILIQHRPNLTIITRGTFWFETAEEVARLSSTRNVICTYRRSLLAKATSLALAFVTHSASQPAISTQSRKQNKSTNILSLPLDVFLLILSPIAEKDFGRTAVDLELLFRFVIAHADEWRRRIRQSEPVTVLQQRKFGKSKLLFKDYTGSLPQTSAVDIATVQA